MKKNKETFPFQVILYVEDSKLKFIPGSHVVIKSKEYEKKQKMIYPKAGDILCFHGGLLHAGAGFKEKNVRLHFYMSKKDTYREQDRVEECIQILEPRRKKKSL